MGTVHFKAALFLAVASKWTYTQSFFAQFLIRSLTHTPIQPLLGQHCQTNVSRGLPTHTHTPSIRTLYLLDRFHRQLGRRYVVGQRMLVDVQRGQPQRHLRLQFRRKAFLRHIVAALHVQVVEGAQVALGQLGGRHRHECDAEEAAQLVRAGSGGYLLLDKKRAFCGWGF